MKTIAVLLTVHNRKEKTVQCLQDLFQQQVPKGYSYEVYMLDDGCSDGTPETISVKFPLVEIIEGDGTLYWNRGMYKAWKVASNTKDYDFYLWLNDDTVLNKGTIKILLKSSVQMNNKSIIVGTTADFENRDKITYGGRCERGRIIHPTNNLKPCNYFNGNIVLFPKHVYRKVGMNDPIFRHTLGDYDYGLRAFNMGVASYVAPNVLGYCEAHESLATWCNPNKPFKERWKAFRSPLGNNPEEFFIFEKRHNGIIMAVFHYFTNFLRVLFPQLWSLK